jgi:hypothetical protein
MPRRLPLALATALVALLLAVPLAAAYPASDGAAEQAAYGSDAGGTGGGSVIVLSDPGSTTRSLDNGFDWGDAAIGAGVFLVLFAGLGLVTLRPNARHGIRIH